MKEAKLKILVVDDEDYVRRLLARLLEEAGYEVATAANGRQALDRLAQDDVNLVLLDIRMPELDGFETLKLIRKQSEIPVIMVTGIGDVNILYDTMTLGADDYVEKPFDTRQLLARIQTKLRRASMSRHLEALRLKLHNALNC